MFNNLMRDFYNMFVDMGVSDPYTEAAKLVPSRIDNGKSIFEY